jgi:heptosyltransferase-2
MPTHDSQPDNFTRILVRATNWVGDAVMSLPALRVIRARFPKAHIAILARPWVAGLYEREPFADSIHLLETARGVRGWTGLRLMARRLEAERFDSAILLPNSFESALLVWMANIPRRIGYSRDGRGSLLTDPIRVPGRETALIHERFYYLELLRRARLLGDQPVIDEIRLDGAPRARDAGRLRLAGAGLPGVVVGVSPGAAFGTAKRWLPERFAEAAARVARSAGGGVAVFGSKGEAGLCEGVAEAVRGHGVESRSFAGSTTLTEFIEMAAACALYLTNDSGAMHISSALGVPTVAVFGATEDRTTGPAGAHSVVVREHVECSPCQLRQCPLDHRCMTRVGVDRVVEECHELFRKLGT